MGFPISVAVEAENANDSGTMFRLRIDGKVVEENLTAAQAHLLVGDELERIVLPSRDRSSPKALPRAAMFIGKDDNQANAHPHLATVGIVFEPAAWSRVNASASALASPRIRCSAGFVATETIPEWIARDWRRLLRVGRRGTLRPVWRRWPIDPHQDSIDCGEGDERDERNEEFHALCSGETVSRLITSLSDSL